MFMAISAASRFLIPHWTQVLKAASINYKIKMLISTTGTKLLSNIDPVCDCKTKISCSKGECSRARTRSRTSWSSMPEGLRLGCGGSDISSGVAAGDGAAGGESGRRGRHTRTPCPAAQPRARVPPSSTKYRSSSRSSFCH